MRADIANHPSNSTPKRPIIHRVSDEHRPHEMAIRLTIQRDVEAYPDEPTTKSKELV